FTAQFSVPLVLVLLVGGGLFFTAYFKLVNVRKIPVAFRTIQGRYDTGGEGAKADNKPVAGELTHFQALTAAISGTVGLGNIAGVAVAIAIGGPGATFWMIVSGLIGMSTKFVECTLGVKYRDVDEEGRTYGGPMYYLTKGFKEIGAGRF